MNEKSITRLLFGKKKSNVEAEEKKEDAQSSLPAGPAQSTNALTSCSGDTAKKTSKSLDARTTKALKSNTNGHFPPAESERKLRATTKANTAATAAAAAAAAAAKEPKQASVAFPNDIQTSFQTGMKLLCSFAGYSKLEEVTFVQYEDDNSAVVRKANSSRHCVHLSQLKTASTNEDSSTNSSASSSTTVSAAEKGANAATLHNTSPTDYLETKRPAEKMYYYMDNSGNVNGPFPLSQMNAWMSFFNEYTLMKEKQDDALMPLDSFPELAAEMRQLRQLQGRQMGASGGVKEFKSVAAPAPASFANKPSKKPQVKRLKNSPSESMVQVKDAVVRQQFESMSKKLAVVQKMTSYTTKKQNDSNAPFQPCLVTFDGINVRPDKLPDVDRP
jgi:hypothetical protein